MQNCKRLPVQIVSLGSYLPEGILTNQDFERMVDTSDDWIIRRTGIRTRHVVADDQATSDLAVAAAQDALSKTDIDPARLDAVIVATVTPDSPMPATACLVQNAIGAANAFAFDLEACSGFVFGVSTGSAMVASGLASYVMVIGAETLTRITDYTDRSSCILFGDGAGAAILGPSCDGSGLLYSEMGADGSQPEVLQLPAGGSRRPASHETVDARAHYMVIQGHNVFRQAVTKLTELLRRVPEATGVKMSDIKVAVPHQSNFRIVKAAFQRAGLSVDKAYMNIDRVGNTSAASIPMAMAEAVADGTIQRGDLVLLLSFGGGLTWGATLLRY